MTTPSAPDAVSSSAPSCDQRSHRRHPGPCPVLPVAHRHPARRPDPHRPVQLGPRPPHEGHVRVPHRGHGRGTRLGGELPAAARGPQMARHHLGGRRGGRRTARAVPPVTAPGPVQGRRRQADRRRLRLRVLLLPGGGRGAPPRRRPRPQAGLRQLRPRALRRAAGRVQGRGPRSRCSACGCPTRMSRSRTWSAARSPSRPAASRTT